MKRKNLIAPMALLALFSVALIAQAHLTPKESKANSIVFNSKVHGYQATSSVPFMSLSIEQRYRAIQSINANEDNLARKDVAKAD